MAMKGKRHLAGSPLTHELTSAPAQEPLLPISQLEPTIGDLKIAEEVLQPPLVVRDGKKKSAPKKYRKPLTARKRYGYSRLEVAALLDRPGVEEVLSETMVKQYRSFAHRNVTIGDLAKEYRVSETAMDVIVEGWESDIVAKTCEIYPRFQPFGTETPDASEKAENESEAAQDADVARTGGTSIGGRIVSRGLKPSPGKTFHNKKLDTFERSGPLAGTESAGPDPDLSGSHVSEEDNYGENSGDDIWRSE
jgi:hypothetical protein